jgi:hypothetical protein
MTVENGPNFIFKYFFTNYFMIRLYFDVPSIFGVDEASMKSSSKQDNAFDLKDFIF